MEGGLEPGDRSTIESHLIGCDRCQAEVEETRSLFAALASLPQFDPGPGFALRVMSHVVLPDPWYVRAGQYLQVLVPKTTRGWAFASGIFSLPLIALSALTFWLLSKPYVTSGELASFLWTRTSTGAVSATHALTELFLRSDVGIMIARGVEAVFTGGLREAGLIALAFAVLTSLSTWVLYQNLFRGNPIRSQTRRSNYASYSF